MTRIDAGEFTFSGEAETPLGRIAMAGFINDSPGILRHPPRRLGAYGLVYLLHGSGIYQDDNENECEVSAGSLILLFPDVLHTYGPRAGEHWNEFYVIFDGPIFDLWYQTDLLDASRPIRTLQPLALWLSRLQDAVSLPRPSSSWQCTLEICNFTTLLAQICALDEPVLNSGKPEWLGAACGLLESNFGQSLQTGDVARQLHLSHETFRKTFAQSMKISPARYRAQKRIEAACALLQHTSLPQREIARTLGFSDEFHFSKKFREAKGQNPRDFRSAIRQQMSEVDE